MTKSVTLKQKISLLVNSLRFQMITVAAILSLLDLAIAHNWNSTSVLMVIKLYLMVVTGVGTLDSVASRLGSK